MRKSRYGNLAFLAAAMALLLPISCNASQSGAASQEVPATAGASGPATHVAPPLPTDNYCANIASFASDARYALQMKTLEELQMQIEWLRWPCRQLVFGYALFSPKNIDLCFQALPK